MKGKELAIEMFNQLWRYIASGLAAAVLYLFRARIQAWISQKTQAASDAIGDKQLLIAVLKGSAAEAMAQLKLQDERKHLDMQVLLNEFKTLVADHHATTAVTQQMLVDHNSMKEQLNRIEIRMERR